MICRPSDHTEGRPRAGIRTRTGDLEAGTLTTRLQHFYKLDYHTTLSAHMYEYNIRAHADEAYNIEQLGFL